MHIYIKHPQACIHVYKHRHIGFPQLQNHWWMKHYFQQSFVSRLDVSQHWYTDTPTSSPLCFLPTRTTTMSIHNPPHTDTQTRTLVNRELICSYLPLSNSPFWQSEAVQQEAINLHLHLHTARTWRAQCCHIRHTFQELNTLVVKDIYTNTSKHTAIVLHRVRCVCQGWRPTCRHWSKGFGVIEQAYRHFKKKRTVFFFFTKYTHQRKK